MVSFENLNEMVEKPINFLIEKLNLFSVKPLDVLSFTIQHFLAFANSTEPKECSSKLEEVDIQILKLFENLEMNSRRRGSVKSQMPVKNIHPFFYKSLT